MENAVGDGVTRLSHPYRAMKTQKERIYMTELDKLEKLLKERGIEYERLDQDEIYHQFKNEASGETVRVPMQMDLHEIFVPSREKCEWDAICQKGSYGYKDGLLEIYGSIVPEENEDNVIGWLTAEEIVAML